jgi:hypothetical protein
MDNPDPSLGSVSSDLSSYPLRRRGRRLLRTHRDHVPLEQGVKDVLGQQKNTINVPDSDNPVQPQRQIRAMFRKALESMPATDTIEDIIEGLGETSKSTKEVSKAATQHRDIGGSKIKAKGVLTSLRENVVKSRKKIKTFDHINGQFADTHKDTKTAGKDVSSSWDPQNAKELIATIDPKLVPRLTHLIDKAAIDPTPLLMGATYTPTMERSLSDRTGTSLCYINEQSHGQTQPHPSVPSPSDPTNQPARRNLQPDRLFQESTNVQGWRARAHRHQTGVHAFNRPHKERQQMARDVAEYDVISDSSAPISSQSLLLDHRLNGTSDPLAVPAIRMPSVAAEAMEDERAEEEEDPDEEMCGPPPVPFSLNRAQLVYVRTVWANAVYKLREAKAEEKGEAQEAVESAVANYVALGGAREDLKFIDHE